MTIIPSVVVITVVANLLDVQPQNVTIPINLKCYM
jgi:hypothetical protein